MTVPTLRLRREWIICLALILITAAVYLPVRHYPFVSYDDKGYVADNPIVQAGLTWQGFQYAFTTMHDQNWVPLTWLSHMLDCQLFGLNAGWHHLINVFFHAINAVLLFVLFRRLTGAGWQSAIVAALFAWHPLHVESVAWVSERKDVLSTFFGLLALLAYARHVAGDKGQPRKLSGVSRFYFLALFFFVLGLMAKPMLVTLPLAFLLLDYWPLQRVPDFQLRLSYWSRLVWEKWPFLVLAVASCVVTSIAQKRSEAIVLLQSHPLPERLGNAVVSYMSYLAKGVYPAHLALIYPLPATIPWWQVAGAVVALAVITGLIWRARRQCPYLLTGWFWYLGMMVPVIGVMQVGLGLWAMADRYTYLPFIGVFMAVVFGVADWAKKVRLAPVALGWIVGVVLAGYLVATARQLQYWQDDKTLFHHTVAVTKENPMAQALFGTALLKAGRSQEATDHLREAARLLPNLALVQNNLGYALRQTGHPQEAIEHIQEALRLTPPSDNAESGKAQCNLGCAFLESGKLPQAIDHLQRALADRPDDPEAERYLGTAYLQAGQIKQAIACYQTNLKYDPNNLIVLNNLSWVLATCPDAPLRNGTEAVQLAERACQLTDYKKPQLIGTLAAAYAEAGRFGDAVASAQEAHDLALVDGLQTVARKNEELLQLYKAGKPCREQPIQTGATKPPQDSQP